ncbi:hypothetical protein IV498_05465 [Paenarthrobacter sp. Z7-10]|uniref:hypothetical protein n=1 Tax=Paenarthrobacter sp. Z7-10 TaxID=2787635 RepID=UPI0022A8E120|nr:hypothetical protein [Paenarthrobacter sp. Z7-10]MCZ2402645.1 hypothetical protein [Paenarthrobacter sp. Z7-10]
MNLLDMLGAGTPEAATICSRKACRGAATTQLLWNNPKIHSPDRRKIWLACDEHASWLEDYLRTRGLWRQTVPLGSIDGTEE